METNELKSIQSSGKSVDEAIFKGLQKLEISIDEVSIEIIQTETKGILGIGAKPAIVKLTQRPPEEFEVPDYIRKADERFERSRERFDRKAEKAAEKEARREKKNAEKHRRNEEKAELRTKKEEKAPVKEAPAKEPAPVKEEPAAEAAPAVETPAGELPRAEEKPEQRRDKRQKNERRERPERKETREQAEAAEKEPEKVINYTLEEAEGNPAAEFVKGLIEHMGAEATVLAAHDEDCLRLRIESDSMGMLIGHRGETLDAMQYLTGLVVNKNRKTEGYTRITLNTEEYREKREETLKRLAKKVAAQVRATGRPRALEPMNPYERRVLHSTLQNNPDVTTHSEGEEPNRRVVITPRRKGKSYPRGRGGRQNSQRPAGEHSSNGRSAGGRSAGGRSVGEQNDGGESDVISREEYERLYAAARAANPMFSSKPADKNNE